MNIAIMRLRWIIAQRDKCESWEERLFIQLCSAQLALIEKEWQDT